LAAPLIGIRGFETERRLPVAASFKAIRRAFRDGGMLLGRALIDAQIAAFNGTFASVSKKTFAHTLTDEVTQAHDASWPALILKCPTKNRLSLQP